MTRRPQGCRPRAGGLSTAAQACQITGRRLLSEYSEYSKSSEHSGNKEPQAWKRARAIFVDGIARNDATVGVGLAGGHSIGILARRPDVTLPPGQHLIDGFPRFGTHLARPA